VLLDADTHAPSSSNRAFSRYFSLPGREGRQQAAIHRADVFTAAIPAPYELPEERIEMPSSRSAMEMMRSGDSTADHITSRTDQCCAQCTALPDGGRMLSLYPGDRIWSDHTDDPRPS